MLFHGTNRSGISLVVILLLSIIVVCLPLTSGGYVWEEEELGALKYDHKYPFVVLRENAIIYSSKEDGGDHFDIWRMALDGSDHRQLTDNDIDEIKPTSDDDGRKIVFTGENNIYIMDFDGSDQENIVDDVPEEFTLTDASISADRTWVIFSSNMDNDTDKNWGDYGYFTSISMDIWKCEIDGDNAEQLTDHNWDEYSPSLSPDGEKIVFVAEESAGDEDIHIMDSEGDNWERLVTWQNKDDSYPSFSSSGRFIIYGDGNNDDKKAVMYDLDTGKSNYISAETVDERGEYVEENVKGRYMRFYPPTDNINEMKVIYSATSGAFYPKLSIWISEKVRFSYNVNIGPIERESGSYDHDPMEGASVAFTFEQVYYENLTDENGWASFTLPVGKLPGVEINASVGDEWITWNSNYNPPEFSNDLVEIGPVKLHTEETEYWGLPLQGVLVSFAYKEITYEDTTDEEGKAHFRLVINGKRVDWLPSGTIISATWDGETQTWEDGDDEAEFHRYMIELGPIVLKTDSSSYYGDRVQGAAISFSFEGDDYENITDEDGYAHFGPFGIEELPAGTLINVSYKEEWISWEQGDYSIPNFASYTVSIGPINRLTDEWDYSGTAVKGAVVSFEYKGKRYKNITDDEGKAHFTLDVKKLPAGIEIKAEKGGDEISWEQDQSIPKFQYEPTASDWIMDYLGLLIVGGFFLLIVIISIIQRLVVKKTRNRGKQQFGMQKPQPMSEGAFDIGKSSAAKGNDLFNRKKFPEALGQYQMALSKLDLAQTWAKKEKDQVLIGTIEDMLSSVRNNIVSCELAVDKRTVEEGYRDAERRFDSALKSIRDDKLFEGRRTLMELSRKLEHLITIAKSRNFVQAIKNITTFLVKVRENINIADMKMSQGVDAVSFGGVPEIGSAGVMALDVAISGTTKHQGGYVVESLTMKNNTMFDVSSAELKISFDSNILRLSHTYPPLPFSEKEVSVGMLAKGEEKKIGLYFDPLVSTSTYLDLSLIYADSRGSYKSVSMGRKKIDIQSPDFVRDDNINIATLREIMVSNARYQDSKVYGIDPKVPLKDVLTLAKEGISEANISKVRDTASHDMESSWFYATAGSGESIVIRASVISSRRVLEIFCACTKREHLTTVLADISQRVMAKLNERWRQLQPVTQVNVEIKDSIIQRSNLDFGGMGGKGTGGIKISDSVVTRSTVGSGSEGNISVYRNLLIIALQDGYINENEERMLADSRKKLGISIDQHQSLLMALNR